MTSIADSDAIYDIARILPQHQNAISFLNAKLQNPVIHTLNWLDLACGKGQIISQLQDNLSEINRRKLSYTGYDINVDHTRSAERITSRLNLKASEFVHGDLCNFANLISTDKHFDFITCTNTAHELQPRAFSVLVLDSLLRLSDTGDLFIYDMESLDKPELGALPWQGSEIGLLVNTIFEAMGTEFRVHPSVWRHRSCKGWTVLIQKQYLNKSNEEINTQRELILDTLEKEIDRILELRFSECNRLLQSLCRFGTETADDENSKISALFEFWALGILKK